MRKSALIATTAAGIVIAAGTGWAFAPVLPNSPLSGHAANRTIAATPAAWDGGHSIADIVERVEPAVVTITVDEAPRPVSLQGAPFSDDNGPMGDLFRQFFGQFPGQAPQQQQGGQALGSGFLIDDQGDILTNNHVVDGGTHFTVEFADKTIAEATLVGTDPATDLALIHVEKHPGATPLNFADSDKLRVGDPVIAIGDPYGVGQTVTAGVVSARGRSLGNSSYVDYIQTDAPINQGNSGGPLLDYTGQVVGVNSAIFSPSGGNVGIGFAVPGNTARQIVDELKQSGKVQRAWLGAAIQDVTPQIAAAAGLAKAEGAIVSEIDPSGPAAGKLRPGDIVTAFDDHTIREARDLSMAASQAPIGENARISIIRQGSPQTVSVHMAALAAKSATGGSQATSKDAETTPKLGVTVAPLDSDTRQQLGLSDDTRGAVITSVQASGAGERAGLQAGDVIERAGNEAVTDGPTLKKALADAHNDTALLLVDRGGQRRFLAVPLG